MVFYECMMTAKNTARKLLLLIMFEFDEFAVVRSCQFKTLQVVLYCICIFVRTEFMLLLLLNLVNFISSYSNDTICYVFALLCLLYKIHI